MKKSLIYFLLLCAQSVFPAKNMIVNEYSVINGLPHNTVFCGVKDTDGFMWFGTWYGLTSFDGMKFKSYNSRDDYNTDIPPHKIQTIVEANDGNLWVKTIDHKLYLFDVKKEQYYDVFNVIKKKHSVSPKIIKIQKTENGDLLLLTKNKDLLKLKSNGNGQIDVTLLYDSKSKREHKLVNNLLIEDKNYINWIGLDFKIISCKKGVSLKSKSSDFIINKFVNESNSVFTSAYKSGEYLFVGSSNGEIFKINLSNGNVSKINVFQNKGAIQNISSLNNTNLFISINKIGVFEFDERTSNFFNAIQLSSSEIVTNTFIDSYDKVWFEINQNSVIYYDPFNKFSRKFDFPSGKVNKALKISENKENGMFFLCTSGDLFWFDRNLLTVNNLNTQTDLLQNREKKLFFDFWIDNDNILWLASTVNGIFRVSFPKQQFNIFNPSSSIPSNPLERSIKTLFQSSNGDIWVATRNSVVYKLDKNRALKQTFSDRNYQIGNVYHIMEDHKGNLWFSTKGSGIVYAKVNKNSALGYDFIRYVYDEKKPLSISGNDVYYTFEDSKNQMWVALFGGGLNLISEQNGKIVFINKFNSFAKYPKYGLYTEIRNITEDKDGRIWVGTSDGLMSFDSNFKNTNQIDFEIYRNENMMSNISDNDIYVLYKDKLSQIWISVFGGGLNKLIGYDKGMKRPIFKSYSIKEGLNSEVILSIVEDNENSLWLATENAISRFDKQHETFRNFDRFDGFLNVQMEEESAIKLNSGELWFGNRNGILTFNPQKLETYNCNYKTFIVDFTIFNRSLKSFKDDPILKESIKYAKSIELKYNQSTFVIEFAALNYYNQNKVSYKYILEGFENEWHYNGKNRIASYPNIPPGKYVFHVQTIDEANESFKSDKTLEIIVLPPWWLTWWAKMFYAILTMLIVYLVIRAVLFYMKMRNEMYVEQRVSEMKIKFFTNISHELRTPLTLIMGPINELKHKQQLDDKGEQYVSMIEKNATHMLQLVNQILDFRKIQNGKMILHVSMFNLNNLIDSFHKEFSLMSEENEINFNFHLSDRDIMVWADKDKLEIVIRNLLSNAFKYTQSGGSVFVTTGFSDDGKNCYFQVEDTGVGIPPNKVSEIFDRFFQIENSNNAHFPGTGIGLELSKEIVTLHHGSINVDSKPNQGSIFTVLLQLDKSHFNSSEVNFYVNDTISELNEDLIDSSENEQDEQQNDEENTRDLPVLLVVEDNKDLCNLLRLQLEDKYKVYTAGNGNEGLKKVNQYHPDIVVTDQMMPEMTGTEMLNKIRNDFKISHIPVIILTAKNDDESKLNAISMGANAYITKPFNKDYLIARIEQLLLDRKMFREKVWTQEITIPSESTDTYENYLQKKDLQFLEKIHQVIEKNIDNSDFNIDSIADNIGISRSAFFKKLKSLTGLAPVDTIKEVRLTKSIELLKNTDLTVSEIAYAVGFKESGYYGKCFRKKYGQTPTEYMSKYRNK